MPSPGSLRVAYRRQRQCVCARPERWRGPSDARWLAPGRLVPPIADRRKHPLRAILLRRAWACRPARVPAVQEERADLADAFEHVAAAHEDAQAGGAANGQGRGQRRGDAQAHGQATTTTASRPPAGLGRPVVHQKAPAPTASRSTTGMKIVAASARPDAPMAAAVAGLFDHLDDAAQQDVLADLLGPTTSPPSPLTVPASTVSPGPQRRGRHSPLKAA